MSKKETLARHKTIIQCLKKGPCSFEQILARLEQNESLLDYKLSISKRTFQRDLIEIQDLYNIYIQFNRKTQLYEIVEHEKNDYQDRMFEALDIFQALNLNDSISQFIHFDQRKPLGTEHIHGILHAIQNKIQLKFFYKKFWEKDPEIRLIEPYLLKEFKNRWYVFGRDVQKNDLRTFGLDRIQSLQISETKFQQAQNVDVNDYFKNSFGVYGGNSIKPEKIKLLFYGNQGEYIKTMPLHPSQTITEETETHTLVELYLIPTKDFLMELMQFGAYVKVLEPTSLAQQLKVTLEKTLELYP